jgi:uncharacterized protein (DUF302 family)
VTFTIGEPYGAALRKVRTALAKHGLSVPTELDITARIRQQLGAGVAPCTVLYVDHPAALLEAVVFDRGAALLIPQPLVVTGDNRHADVLMRAAEPVTGGVPESVRGPLLDLRTRITRAIETVAVPQEVPAAIS